MFHTPLFSSQTIKFAVGIGLCTLGSAMFYIYFKSQDEDGDQEDQNPKNDNSKKKTVVQLNIPAEHYPLLIGRNGNLLEMIKNKTSTDIQIIDKDKSEKRCEIRGYPADVRRARDLIMSQIDRAVLVTEKIPIDKVICKELLGRGSDNLTDIIRQSGAKVSVSTTELNTDKCFVQILGTRLQVDKARLRIKDFIKEQTSIRNIVDSIEENRPPRRSPSNNNNSSSLSSSQPNLLMSTCAREKLAAAETFRKTMEVYVSAIASPSKFWIQLIGQQTEMLDSLVKDMTDYYTDDKNREKNIIAEPFLNQMVAARFEYDKKWYRAKIVSILPNPHNQTKNIYDLFFVDYGDNEYVEIEDMYCLHSTFLSLRFQATECFLANLKSTNSDNSEVWSEQAIKRFAELTHVALWKRLIVYIVETQYRSSQNESEKCGAHQIVGIELYDSSEGCEINIGDLLIAEGHALPINKYPSSTTFSTKSLSRSNENFAIKTNGFHLHADMQNGNSTISDTKQNNTVLSL